MNIAFCLLFNTVNSINILLFSTICALLHNSAVAGLTTLQAGSGQCQQLNWITPHSSVAFTQTAIIQLYKHAH